MEEHKFQNEVHIKIGVEGIEFDAKGDASFIERERNAFEAKLLPLGVDAIARTRSTESRIQYIEPNRQPADLLAEANEAKTLNESFPAKEHDFTRVNLASFLKQFGSLSEQDFTLFSAYFDEIKNGTLFFSKEEVEKYYDEARRTKPSNISVSLYRLAEKGLIMDVQEVERKIPKPYKISIDGMHYIETYKKKEESEKKALKSKRIRTKVKSDFATINIDELSLAKYVDISTLKEFKQKMITIMYIISNEGKGEWFTVADVLCLITDIFGEAATKDQVNGVFKREKTWFKSENVDGNSKEVKRKLLNKGIEYAKSLTSSK